MARPGKYRSLASLALLRLTESDLRSLHATVSQLSPSAFLELIRDIEDEIDNSIALIQDRATERAFFGFGSAELYHEVNQIRTTKLRMPVSHFADMLADSLSTIARDRSAQIPSFDSRRGLQAWIGKLVHTFSEHDVLHAAMRLVPQRSDYKDSDWKLR